MKDCVTVVRPSSRIIARSTMTLPAPDASLPAAGSGAAIGPIRRIVTTVLLVCAAGSGAAATAVVVAPLLGAPKGAAPAEVEAYGVRHYARLRDSAAVPVPGGALLFVPAVLALSWLRRGVRADRMQAPRGAASPRAGAPPGFLPIASAGRAGSCRRAPRFFRRRGSNGAS